ncbi:pRL2-23 [Streptomyces oryzae]|uniref:PRL2-23 n=2 Tax=Streptomyces oryzae TaxID=1434886 RepID=A0ABS3XE49_9ACTN|nr:pRL2-23 [Streptomyces oryzae]
MWASLLAVLGTLAGALVSGLLQHRAARADRTNARTEQLRRDRMNAVTALAVALSDHRRAMWEVRDAQLAGKPDERVQELRDESHRTRSGITDPSVRMRLLISDEEVRAAALAATHATYAMRDAANTEALQAARSTALALHDHFVDTAGAHLA